MKYHTNYIRESVVKGKVVRRSFWTVLEGDTPKEAVKQIPEEYKAKEIFMILMKE
ncbi:MULTISPECIES: hypothetical protein [Bacillus]|uniref:hypothetical protein n=1 Tax=Bacillus TaxID=1386 RepID=UPI000A30182B|nr:MULTISPECIES: hypothetical protein [Bacillus cereus group]SME48319.1 hypothetical protein BACERE00183_04082 [Bacillus cereus]